MIPKMSTSLHTLALSVLVHSTAIGQQLAFPTAEGFGRFAAGGRGGDVYHVTSLEDSSTQGTFRHGVETAPDSGRTIVFDVGGRIDLSGRLLIQSPHLTIAGQTAPGAGITLSGYGLILNNTHDVIIRHLRLRPGDLKSGTGPGGFVGDSIAVTNSQNVILDHVSASWSIDETIEVFGSESDNVTIQWSTIAESLHNSFHPEGPHGYGALLTRQEDGGLSFHHNLLAHHFLRNPRAGGVEEGPGLRLDFVNNVIYNWGLKAGHGGPSSDEFPEGANNNLRMNYVGNYLIAGIDTEDDRVSQAYESFSPLTRIFQSNNLIDADRDGTLNGVDLGWNVFEGVLTQIEAPFAFPAIDTQSPEIALQLVLSTAGATLGRSDDGSVDVVRDGIDARIVSDVWNLSGSIIDSQSEVGGWDIVEPVARPADYDTDGDGMPDTWEVILGLNPSDPDDRNLDIDNDGYTNLEEFLNGTGLPGDYNGNGVVDAADYVVWRDGLGTSYTPAHFDVWRAHFGESAGAGADLAGSVNVAVPEPETMLIAAAAIFGLSFRGRTARRLGLTTRRPIGATAIAQQYNMLALMIAFGMVAAAAVAQPPPPSFMPLNDLGSGLYLNQFQGGLYPNGSNSVPSAHAAEGLARALAIRPLNTLGEPDVDGKYVLISIGMSNTTQEFCSGTTGACSSFSFMGQAAVHPAVDHTSLFIVDGAKGGRPAEDWDSPNDPDYDRIANELLTPNGLSEQQVQAAWVKVANPGPTISLPDANANAYKLVRQMGDISRALKTRYPSLQQVFFSSRIYAGYARSTLNPEPYAYESGLAVKWLIEAQINQVNGGGVDPLAGDLDYSSGVAPWIAWGPYLWADGLNPRSDGLIWEQTDFSNDGTHPSVSGREKVGTMLMDFMLNSAFTQPWFLSRPPGDYNNDGAVDAADYVVWRSGLGGTLTPDHYNLWRANFGLSAGSGAGGISSARVNVAVPEPVALALILLGVTGSLVVPLRL